MTDPAVAAGNTLVLTERIEAPPATIFEFLVDPEKMLRWMGTEVELDSEPGGKFWLNATGTDIAIGNFVEIDPPDRVVFTWGWEGSTDVPGSSTVTITLTPDDDATILELRHDGLPDGAGDQHTEGWTYFLGRLGAVAVGGDPGPDRHATS